MSSAAIFGVACLVVAAYLLPTILAFLRRRPQTAGVLVLNLALGWTILGWIAAFVWAARKPGAKRVRPPKPPRLKARQARVTPDRAAHVAQPPKVTPDAWRSADARDDYQAWLEHRNEGSKEE